jgi:predicted small secreted protein
MDGRLPDFDCGAERLDDRVGLFYSHRMALTLRSILIVLFAAVALPGCGTWSGVKQDTQAAKDYTYEKKDEYRSRLEYQMQELDAKTEELKGKAANASESVKREFDKDMSELSRQKAVLNQKLESVKSSSAAAWEDTKAGAESAWDSVKRTYERARSRFQ